MDKSELPQELPMVRATEEEYTILAHKLGTTPAAKYLVMSNGTRVGWRSNRYAYVSPIAFKVASGRYPKNCPDFQKKEEDRS